MALFKIFLLPATLRATLAVAESARSRRSVTGRVARQDASGD